MNIHGGNVLVVDNQEDYTTTSSHDSGISLTNGNSVCSPLSSLKSTLDADTETQSIEKSQAAERPAIALNQLADVASKEGSILSSYSNTANNDQVVPNMDIVQSFGHTQMCNLEEPASLYEVSNEKCEMANSNNDEEGTPLGNVPIKTIPHGHAYSSIMCESGPSSSSARQKYSMAGFDGRNVVALYSGGDSSTMGQLDSRFDFGCNQMSIYSGDYNAQVVPSATSDLPNDGSADYFMCKNCCREFSQHDSLMLHMKSCNDKRMNAVAIVNPFDPSNSVENRIDIRSERSRQRSTRSILCKYCQRSFPTQHQVMSHERVHTGARPYSCYICKVTFAHGGNMIKHIKNKHPNNNPYKCRHCQKAFKTYQDIQAHRKNRSCGSNEVLSTYENTHSMSPPAITRIPKPHHCDENCCTTICGKGSPKSELDEDTDSSSESEDQQKIFILAGTSHPTLTAVTPSSNFLVPKIKSEYEMKPTMPLIPSSESECSWRHDLELHNNPKPSVLEQDANLLLEYPTSSQIKTEPVFHFDHLQDNFKCHVVGNVLTSNNINVLNIKTELLD
ncbi:unnamed protein product [Orchesella dallaii]